MWLDTTREGGGPQRSVLSCTAAACRCGDPGRCVLTLEAQESDVAIVAAVGPDKEERVEKLLDKTSSSGTPHDGAVASRALVHFFGEQELHGWSSKPLYCVTRVFWELQRAGILKFRIRYGVTT